jgi:hypothetical protein
MSGKTTYLLAGISLTALLIFSGCGSEQEKETSENTKQDSVQTAPEEVGGKIFSLPAPMQVASAIKRSGAKYSESYLCPVKNSFTSDFSRLLNLGIYSADLGYANVYEQTQTSLTYFTTAAKLADEIKIVGDINAETIKRYKNNINNKDSVTFFTLNSFNNIHNYLAGNKRTDEAYLIITGCFVEGVYLSTMSCDKTKNKDLVSLVGQQKMFLESILELLTNHQERKEMPELITKLTELKQIYDKVEIKYASISEPGVKKMEPIAISDEALASITSKITEIRNGIIK